LRAATVTSGAKEKLLADLRRVGERLRADPNREAMPKPNADEVLKRITEIVRDRHASVDFLDLLGKLDAEYPPQARIRLLLDNHSAHLSKETQAYLSLHPQRFEFVFTPKHGSWLNIVETMFSKMARTMLRGIRVASKQELIDRIHLYFAEVNAYPVIFRWNYKMDETSIV
jgi:transposase